MHIRSLTVAFCSSTSKYISFLIILSVLLLSSPAFSANLCDVLTGSLQPQEDERIHLFEKGIIVDQFTDIDNEETASSLEGLAEDFQKINFRNTWSSVLNSIEVQKTKMSKREEKLYDESVTLLYVDKERGVKTALYVNYVAQKEHLAGLVDRFAKNGSRQPNATETEILRQAEENFELMGQKQKIESALSIVQKYDTPQTLDPILIARDIWSDFGDVYGNPEFELNLQELIESRTSWTSITVGIDENYTDTDDCDSAFGAPRLNGSWIESNQKKLDGVNRISAEVARWRISFRWFDMALFDTREINFKKRSDYNSMKLSDGRNFESSNAAFPEVVTALIIASDVNAELTLNRSDVFSRIRDAIQTNSSVGAIGPLLIAGPIDINSNNGYAKPNVGSTGLYFPSPQVLGVVTKILPSVSN